MTAPVASRPSSRRNPSKREILADVRRRVGLTRTDLAVERYEASVDETLTALYAAMLQQARVLLQQFVDALVQDYPAVEYLTADEQRLLETWLLASLRDLAEPRPAAREAAFAERYAQLGLALEPKLRGLFTAPRVAKRMLALYGTALPWYATFVGDHLRDIAGAVQDFPAVRQARLTRAALVDDYWCRLRELLPERVA